MDDNKKLIEVLHKIERVIDASMSTLQQEEQARRNLSRRKGGKKESEADFTDLNNQIIRATTRIQQLVNETEKLSKNTEKAHKELSFMRRGIRSSTAAFSGLKDVTAQVVSSMQALKPSELPETDALSSSISGVKDKSDALHVSFGQLTTTSRLLRKAFQGLIASVRGSRKELGSSTAATTTNTEATIGSAEATGNHADATRKATNQISNLGSFFGGMLNRFGIDLKGAGDSAEWFKSQLTNLAWALSDTLINLTRDMFYLQSRGISASDSLFGLYGNAMKAGMSLQEYTSMLQENSAAVVRAGSFEEFGDSVDRTTRQLNRLGVFGPAAEQLAASLRTTAVTVGISRETQEAAVNSQIQLFEQLRKTTLMTADAFRELQADIANNQMVQEELLGLAPAERAARLQQITQGATIGYQLGATAQASKQLQEALLAQRRATVKDRFKAAGTIRMGGAILGIDTSRVEEYAKLMMKNPALRTEEDKKRIAELAGDYQQFLQTLKSSPNPALENIADELGALAPAVQSELQTAAGTVKLQAEAGLAQNAEIGKQTSGFMQDIGRGLTTLSGFMKNPLADAMVIFGSILAQTVIQSSLLTIIAKNTGSTGGIFKLFGKKPGNIAGKVGKGGALASFGSFLAETFSSAAGIDITGRRAPGEIREKGIGARIAAQNEAKAAENAAKAAKAARGDTLLTRLLTPIFGNMFGMSALNSLNFTAEGDLIPEQTKKGIVGRLGDGLKSSMGKIFGIFKSAGPFSIIFGAIEEAFTGEMATSLDFGDDIGGRLLGVLVGGLNSFFTGITRLVDGSFNWVMEGLGINFKFLNLNLTKLFDTMTIILTMGAKTILSSFARVFSDIIGFFNKDAPWAKSLRQFSDEQDAAVVAQAETLKTLWNTEGATLRSMGEQQIKAQKETADKSKQLAAATKNSTVWGAENVLASAKSTAQTLQAEAMKSQTAVIATPQPTQQSQVTPPEVNKTQSTEEKTKGTQPDGTMLAIAGMEQLISNTQQQLDILKQMLALNMKQGSSEETLADQIAKLPKQAFSDNTTLHSWLINGHAAA